jgi:hypothetical protein
LGAWVGADWVSVEAKRCDLASGECEPVAAGKIRVESVSRNGGHAYGSYSFDFPNTGHDEGKFTVKDQHKGQQIICE